MVHFNSKNNEKLKTEIEMLKKALAESAIDNQILKLANDVLKKDMRQEWLKRQKKSSKK